MPTTDQHHRIDYLEFKAGRLPFAEYFKENFRIRLEAKRKAIYSKSPIESY